MNEKWYLVEGIARYRNGTVHLIDAELLVKAVSIEDACKRTQEFFKPIADFEPTSCKWNGE